MLARVGSLVMAALVALAPAIVLAQLPPGMPNMEELMRQYGAGAPGKPPAGRTGGAATPAPPGVPVPPDSPLIAAFERLDGAKTYRQVIEMTSTDPRALEMMRQMGMDRMDKTVVKPNQQVISFHLAMPATYLPPGQVDDWEVRAVIKGNRLARKFSTPSEQKILAMQRASVAKQLAQADMAASMSIAQSAFMGPMGAISAGVQAASVVLSHAAAASTLKQAEDFFKWTCSDAPARASEARSRDSVTFTDLVDLGERTDGDVPVHGYRFFVREQGQYHGPVEVDIARGSGLPTRFAMSEPSSGGGMIMHYYDYDQPATIELPPCMAK